MSDHIKQTIAELQTKLREQEDGVALTKRMINDLCKLAGLEPIYAESAAESKPGVSVIRGDQFYGRGLSTVVREYLEMRRASNLGPAAVSEIHEALVRGGFKFETKNAANAIRGLRQSLTKNSATFHKLPGGEYGLLEWYPSARRASRDGNEEEATPVRRRRKTGKARRMRKTTAKPRATIAPAPAKAEGGGQ